MTPLEYPSGKQIIRQLQMAGIRFVVSLPDIVTSSGLLWPIARNNDFELIRVCKEDEGVSICAAMSYNGTRAVLLMQQTGLMDSLNSIRAIAMDYQLPVVMMVGLQGKEPESMPKQSSVYGVRIIPSVLEAMSVPFSLIQEPSDSFTIQGRIESCYADSKPHVFLIGRTPVE
ncbi:MAG: decarboxylase [Rhodobacteraceae bacterium]|nr:decarboxylase [Paracoccaceae bacterium]